ncbi:MAG: S41 family peptidase [Bacteroidales bacterium]|jgi:carboxyl-terminal processing protease|nr:S41 family peptidase [Bacteroidales bacterium]
MTKKFNVWLPLIIAVCLVAGILLGQRFSAGRFQAAFVPASSANKLDVLINAIEANYVDTVDRSALIESAVPAILGTLDPHSTYIEKRNLQEVNEEMQGNFGGIGIQFSIFNDTVNVVDVITGGPSYELGIQTGDRIVEVNGEVIAGVKIKQDDVLHLLRGEKGTKVMVGIRRRGLSDIINYDITRGDIPLISIDVSYMIDAETGYVKVTRFSEKTYGEFTQAVEKLDAQGARKLIIDLRGNPGGLLQAVIRMVNDFLDKDEPALYVEGRTRARYTYLAPQQGRWFDKELYVLIDEYSASASEIFAGAIQDNDRGLIIGRRSFGKGLVQEQILFGDGSAMRLTVSRYYTPSGRCIQKPYQDGQEEYQHDLEKRSKHGEFLVADSIRFADSLQYKTKFGRTVYGGGGIMPDCFVPFDTTGFSPYYSKIYAKQLVYNFAHDYSENHLDELKTLADVAEFKEHLTREHILDQFVAYATKHGVAKNDRDLKISGKMIDTQVKAYIAKNIIGDVGLFGIIRDIDEALLKAVKLAKENAAREISHQNQ